MLTSILPSPKDVHRTPGVCHVSHGSQIELRVEDPRIERALLEWRSGLGGGNTPVDGAASCRLKPEPGNRELARILVAVDPVLSEHPQGYRLIITPDEVELIGGSPCGCFHGLQTLVQLERRSQSGILCCSISDSPDLGTRGLLHDVTRGRVPTLQTLKMLVDRFALLKINQLQLYIEHAFVFSFDSDICSSDEGLTPDEVRSLDEYCRERFIALVPAVATFGHMGRILSMPKYRHLAEVEAPCGWSDLSWPQRARGFTLDCANPDSRQLVKHIWSDILEAFSASTVNLCGDEPWDLGQGKNLARFAQCGTTNAYLDHLRYTYNLCTSRGRGVQAWSDIIRNHPELVDRLPGDLTMLHWGYDDEADYDATGLFTDAGLETFVCPGTTGWKRILNAMNLAQRNIATFSDAAHKHGATGLLNTDWGDHGHFNLLACSWHGIAFGAARAWNVHQPTGDDFDSRLAGLLFGVDDAEPIRLLRTVSTLADSCETWPLLYQPLRAATEDVELPSPDAVAESRDAARQFQKWRENITVCDSSGWHGQTCLPVGAASANPRAPGPLAPGADLDELAIACRFTEILADKIDLARTIQTNQSGARVCASNRKRWAEELVAAGETYADCWRARYKSAGLADIDKALSAAARDIAG